MDGTVRLDGPEVHEQVRGLCDIFLEGGSPTVKAASEFSLSERMEACNGLCDSEFFNGGFHDFRPMSGCPRGCLTGLVGLDVVRSVPR